MALSDLSGWMPVDAVVVNGRPGLAWMNMADVSLAEPFFQQTIDKLKSERPDRGELFTEFHTLIQFEKSFDSIAPSGFIFHASRCGSTLLANACRAIDGAVVLSEPPAVDKLIARFITDIDEHGVKEKLYSIFLRAVVAALGQKRSGDERHLFIKFSCCSVSQIDRVRRLWPDVPWVFLYRDPIETIVSNLRHPPTWLQDEDHRVLASIIGTPPAQVAEMGLEELCARSIGSFFSSACEAHRVANDRALLLNYNQLSLSEFAKVFHFFGVTPAAVEMDYVVRETRKYSKAISGERLFVTDTEAKQLAATRLVREMSERWAAGPYQLLEQKRLENKQS